MVVQQRSSRDEHLRTYQKSRQPSKKVNDMTDIEEQCTVKEEIFVGCSFHKIEKSA